MITTTTFSFCLSSQFLVLSFAHMNNSYSDAYLLLLVPV